MGALIFLTVVISVCFLGRLFIKKWRRDQENERLRRLRIAEGNFDSEPPEPAPPKRRKRWLKRRSPNELPEYVERELYNRLPLWIEDLLQSKHKLVAEHAAVAACEAEFSRCTSEWNAFALPQRLEPGNLETLITRATMAAGQRLVAGRAFIKAAKDFNAAAQRHAEIVDNLTKWFDEFSRYESDDLAEEGLRIRQTATLAFNEVKYQVNSPQKTHLPAILIAPKEIDPELESSLEQSATALQALLALVPELSTSRHLAAKEFGKLPELSKVPAFVEPQKPAETEVQSMFAGLMSWATELQNQEQAAGASLPRLKAALAAFDEQMLKTQAQFAELVVLKGRKVEEQEAKKKEREKREQEEALSAMPYWQRRKIRLIPVADPAVPGAADTTSGAGSSAAALTSDNKPVWRQFDAEAERRAFPSRLQDGQSKRPTFKPAAEKESILSDDQESRDNCHTKLVDLLDAYAQSVREHYANWQRRPLSVVSPESDETELARLASLNSALRKIGFAIAQCNAARAKLNAIQVDGQAPSTGTQPSLDDTSAEAFIRNFRKNKDEAARAQEFRQQRQARIEAQQAVVLERDEQRRQAALELKTLLAEFPKAGRDRTSAQLDATERCAEVTWQRYSS